MDWQQGKSILWTTGAAVLSLVLILVVLNQLNVDTSIQTVVIGVLGIMAGSVLTILNQNWADRRSEETQMRLAQRSHDSAVRLADLNYENQMRLAALDKRLEAHQEAYGRWRKLLFPANQQDFDGFLVDCQIWWEEHCLYLTQEAGLAFHRALIAAGDLRAAGYDNPDRASVAEMRAVLKAAGPIIASGVALPAMGQIVLKDEQSAAA